MATTTFTVDMRAPLDRLKADMGGATGVVVNAARQMERGFSGIGSAVGSSLSSLLTFGAILGTLTGAAGIGLLVKHALSLGSELNDMASRSGLAVEKLQELQFAAATVGVNVEKLDTSFKFLNQSIQEAAGDPGSKAAQMFRDLGVAVTVGDEIRGLASVFDDLADAMQRSTSPTKDAAVAQELLGRAGFKMIPIMKGGSAGLRELGDEARRVGAVMSGEVVNRLDAADDAIEKLSKTIKANLGTAIAELTPSITAFAETLAKLAGVIGPMLQTVLSPERVGSNELQRRLVSLQEEMKRAQTLAADGLFLSDSLNKLFGQDVEGRRAGNIARIQGEIDKIEDLIKARAKADAGLTVAPPAAKIPPLTDAQAQAVEEAKRIVESLSPSLTEAERKLLALSNQFDGLAKAAGNGAPRVREFQEQAKALVTAIEGEQFIKKWTDAFDDMIPTLDTVGKQLEAVRRKTEELVNEAPAFQKSAIKLRGEEVQAAIVAFDKAKKSLDALTESWQTDAAEARDWAEVVRAARAPIDELDDVLRDHIIQLEALATATGALSGSGIPGQATFGQGQAQQLEAQIQRVARSRAQLNAELRGVDPGERFDELADAIDKADAELIQLGHDLRRIVEENQIAQLAKDMQLINDRVAIGGDAFEALSEKIARNRQEIDLFLNKGTAQDTARAAALQQQNNLLESQVRIAAAVGDIVGRSMTTAFDTVVDAFARGELAAVQWGDVVQQILSDIIKTLFQVLVVETAIKAVRGIASSAFGGGDVGGLDAGGIVMKPGIFALAEKGRPEAVIPLDKFDFGGRGGDVTINIHPPAGTESNAQESQDSKGNRTIEVFITKTVQKGIGQGLFDRDLGGSFGLARQGARR